MRHWIGTSGFQYSEWKGSFYPETMSAAKMLPFYAERIATTEINYTFRQIPSAKSIQTWNDATPARFKFSFKAPQKVTHFAKLRDCAETVSHFHGVVSALKEKLGVVLFQLPATFKKDAALLRTFLNDIPKAMRVTFEFRHESWFVDEVYEVLGKHNAALCVAESEELSSPLEATANFGYLRLRREDYSSADIKRWAKALEKHAGKWSDMFVYFKHEDTGSGPKFARQLLDALG
jgi:uncharacterized protein YecE (DUF72 family)